MPRDFLVICQIVGREKIGKRTTLHLECRKKREKKAGGERGVISISMCLDKKMFFFFLVLIIHFFVFPCFPHAIPSCPSTFPPSLPHPGSSIHLHLPRHKTKALKVEIEVVGSIIKKFYLERVESKKWNVVSLFFSFFLRSKNRVGREKRILAYLRYEGHLNVKTMN